MKRILIALAMLLAVTGVSAQDKNYERRGNVFIQKTGARTGTKAEPKATAYKWKDGKGKEYPIFLSANGSAFVNRVSAKTGKEYRHYLGEQMSREICSEMRIEYKGKSNKK